MKDKLAGAQSLGDTPMPENVLALHPDLIVVFSGTEGIDELQKIAPVVAIDYGAKTYKDQLIEFGQLTNKEAEAQAWIEQWEAQINELKPKVQEEGSHRQRHGLGIHFAGDAPAIPAISSSLHPGPAIQPIRSSCMRTRCGWAFLPSKRVTYSSLIPRRTRSTIPSPCNPSCNISRIA
ncbi:ABC transporter substrate-binding protein [Paenibacillus sp. Leaf72]|uniref:ABC transporter substrate-binding protein n=1 Tax=Paenibacillus sp. Leaf72 TaxID=1736234 RepID=UPI0009D6A00E|nr:ABC transporter substrate-binding protein [Paenibacillus sp. Leaf72]